MGKAAPFRLWFGALALAVCASTADASGLEQFKGRVVGERCAVAGKIGDCYLAWANPMVLWTEEGDTYQIELTGEGLGQSTLDKVFGREVIIEGELRGEVIAVRTVTALNPPGKKEFFKG